MSNGLQKFATNIAFLCRTGRFLLTVSAIVTAAVNVNTEKVKMQGTEGEQYNRVRRYGITDKVSK